jgi:hypothetical protein
MGWNWEMQAKINEKSRKIKQLEEELEAARKPNFCYSWDFGEVNKLKTENRKLKLAIELYKSYGNMFTSSD